MRKPKEYRDAQEREIMDAIDKCHWESRRIHKERSENVKRRKDLCKKLRAYRHARAAKIRHMFFKEHKSQKEIREIFGCCQTTVSKCVSNKTCSTTEKY